MTSSFTQRTQRIRNGRYVKYFHVIGSPDRMVIWAEMGDRTVLNMVRTYGTPIHFLSFYPAINYRAIISVIPDGIISPINRCMLFLKVKFEVFYHW